MNKPTLDILDSINPEYAQYQGISPLTARQNEYTSTFSLNNQAWDEHIDTIGGVRKALFRLLLRLKRVHVCSGIFRCTSR